MYTLEKVILGSCSKCEWNLSRFMFFFLVLFLQNEIVKFLSFIITKYYFLISKDKLGVIQRSKVKKGQSKGLQGRRSRNTHDVFFGTAS